MATYEVNNAVNAAAGVLKLKEHHMYGSSRLGIINRDQDMDEEKIMAVEETNLGNTYLLNFTRGSKFFELTNHLGDVTAVLADLREGVPNETNPSLVRVYNSVMVYASDYTPFGRVMTGRVYKPPWNYRYGFNGKEYDNEVQGGGSLLDYGNRLYDPIVGRFWSVDPLTKKYPELTPYQFASNTPIQGTDLDGLEISYHYDDPRFGVVITQAGDNLSRQIPPEHLKFIPQARNKRSQGIMNEKASMFIDNVPGVGTFKGFVEGVVGYDAAGNELSTFERASGWVPYLGKAKKTFRVLKAANKADEVNDLTKAAHKIDNAVSNEKALVRAKDKTDFVVTPDGVAVPKNQDRMRDGFDKAGFPKKAATETSEGGVIHTVPTKNGKVDVRTMEGSSKHPKRAVITHPNTNSPKTPSGKATSNKKDNHIEQH